MKAAGGDGADEAVDGAWLTLSDALLRGVGHAMNNRAAALSAVVQVLAATGPEGPLESALRSETGRLQRVVELLRLLPRRWESEPEPVLIGELVPSAIELLALHSDLPETRYAWEAEGGLSPVLIEPSLLIHVLCLLGTAAANEAARTGARAVTFRGSGSEDAVRVDILLGESDERLADPAAPGAGEDPMAAAALLARAGGELTMENEGELRLSFILPTLGAARRRAG